MSDGQRLSESVCVGTLALGLQYRVHAKLLAFDLLLLHPDIMFIILTDEPDFFCDLHNVIPIKHRSTGIRFCYHDKRFVFEAAFQQFDSCLFVDADSRLVDTINFEELLSVDAFIVAPIVEPLVEKLELEVFVRKSRFNFNNPLRKRRIFEKLSKLMRVDISEVAFIQESIFLINKKKCNYGDFLSAWNYCALFTTARLFEFSEGSSIGLSAAYVGANISSLKKGPAWYFKDIYTDYKWKNDRQAYLSKNLILLRKAISNDRWPRERMIRPPISFIIAAVFFYVKNVRCLISVAPPRGIH